MFDAIEVRSDHGGTESSVNECMSHVFLYPFSIFVTHSEETKTYAEQLQGRVDVATQLMRLPIDPESNGTAGIVSSDGATIAAKMQSGSLRKVDKHSLESQKAFQYQQFVMYLLDEDLKPISDFLDNCAKGLFEQVAFENLWLLFGLTTCVFYQELDRGHPPALVRVSCVTGDRQTLNNGSFRNFHLDKNLNPGENLKGRENRFSIHVYSLSSRPFHDPSLLWEFINRQLDLASLAHRGIHCFSSQKVSLARR